MRGDRLKQAKDKIKQYEAARTRQKKPPLAKATRREVRPQDKRKVYPKHRYLWPSKRKYPVVDPTTGKLSCVLIRATIDRAANNGHQNILGKARALYKKYCLRGKK